MPIGLSDSPVIRASSATVMPRRIPSRYMASSTATVSAIAGVPRKNTTDCRLPGARTMLPNVALRISSIGTAMTVAISATDGGRVRTAVAVPPGPAEPSGPSGSAESSRDASSSAAMNSSGTSTWIRLPMNDPTRRR